MSRLTRTQQRLILLSGLAVAVVTGRLAYHTVGPYGDGPFGAGYRRVPDAASGRSRLFYDFMVGDATAVAVAEPGARSFTAFGIDGDGDGRPETTARVAGDGVIRVERDADGDGRVDRSELYGGASQLQKVGFSLAGDGVLDAWAYYGSEGQLTMIEVSTTRDERVDRWEYYEDDVMVRVEEDTTGDGQADRWSTYVDGVLDHTGPP